MLNLTRNCEVTNKQKNYKLEILVLKYLNTLNKSFFNQIIPHFLLRK